MKHVRVQNLGLSRPIHIGLSVMSVTVKALIRYAMQHIAWLCHGKLSVHLWWSVAISPPKLGVQCSKVQALPIPIRSPSIHETFKRENFITRHQFECNEISDSQSFWSTQQSRLILFTVTIIIASCRTGGAKSKAGVQLRPLFQRRTATGDDVHIGWNTSEIISQLAD